MMKISRPDLETTIGFTCTRASKSDEDDWLKLRRGIACVKCAIDDVRLIGASSLTDVYTWIDAACSVNPDVKSQMGGCVTRYRCLHAKRNKQKLNVKSSTGAELVGTSEQIPCSLWLLMFMNMQGCAIKK